MRLPSLAGVLCLFALLAPGAPALALSFKIEPYLQYQQTTSMVVCWRTDTWATTSVDYGLSPSSLQRVSLDGTRRQHEVKLQGLSPNTLYYYRVRSTYGSAVVESSLATLRTASGASKFRFAFITDTQTDGSVNQAFTDEILNFGPEVIFHGGDHVDDGNDIDGDWIDYFSSSKAYLRVKPQYSVLGNHNYRTDAWGIGHDYAQTSLLLFAQPGNERWYTVRRGSVLFIVLDANQDRYSPIWTEERAWLAQVLQQATDGIDDPLLKVALYHQPAFSSGIHTMEFPNVEYDDEFVMRYFVPLFEQYGVNLVLNGHEHFYERSRKAGIVYLICGSAGGGTRGKIGSNPYSQFLEEYANSVFLAEVDVNRITIDVVRPDSSRIETVAIEVLGIRTVGLPEALPLQPYQARISASGGRPPYAFSLRSGSLPSGMTLDAATGTLAGVPSATGTSSFEIAVTDQSGKSHVRAFSIRVAP